MQFKKVFKGMLIAIPVVTMMACSTTEESQVDETAANEAAAAQAEADRKAREAREAEQTQIAAANQRRNAEQVREQTKNMLVDESTVYFDFDRSSIRTDSYSVLDKHADFLSKNPSQSIVIEGHCDSRGTPEYNIALGERRAKAVETYLQNAGVSAYQISVVSYGEEKPVAMGSSEEAFAQNRRGVLVYQ